VPEKAQGIKTSPSSRERPTILVLTERYEVSDARIIQMVAGYGQTDAIRKGSVVSLALQDVTKVVKGERIPCRPSWHMVVGRGRSTGER
jgi:hypothetical protein